MTDATTIKLSQEAKQLLDDENLETETYEDTVRRLLGDTRGKVWTKKEIEEIAVQAVEREMR